MGKRVAAIFFIFLCTTAAWMVLGATIFRRTYASGQALGGRVASTWGSPQRQSPPAARVTRKVPKQVETFEDGKKIVRTIEVQETSPLPLEKSRVRVDLDLEHRQKGLLWYSTYRVGFAGEYVFRNTTDLEEVIFTLPFPASQAIYDDLVLTVDGKPVTMTTWAAAPEPRAAPGPTASVSGTASVPAGQAARLEVRYRSQGLDSWRYALGEDVAQVRDFNLTMRTNFKDIDFPDNTLSPTDKRRAGGGWLLTWSYRSLVSGYEVAMAMPEKLQPGPLAGRISFFAPVSLFFFFFVLLLITTLRGIDLHPVNYFFLAAAFFAFHLLLAYLVDHVSIHAAFFISSAVSLALVVSYLRLVVGMRFAAVEAGLAQLMYLVLFSYAFFFKGFTGLAITIGSILTLFVTMQLTGRIRWSERLAAKPA
ncbi:MAG: inner membrane CreD family protein [Thermoanaerobaculia bacterium]